MNPSKIDINMVYNSQDVAFGNTQILTRMLLQKLSTH